MTRTRTPVERMTSKVERAASTTDLHEMRDILKNAQRFDTFVVNALVHNKRLQQHDKSAREMHHRILNSRFAGKDYHYMAAREIATIAQDKGVQLKIIFLPDWVSKQNLAHNPHLLPELQSRLAHHADHIEIKMSLLQRKDLRDDVRDRLLHTLTEREIKGVVKNIERFDAPVVVRLVQTERMQQHDEFSAEIQHDILDSEFAKKSHNYVAAREIAKITHDKGVQGRLLYGKDLVTQENLARNKNLVPQLQPELAHHAHSMEVKLALLERADLLDNVRKALLSDPKVVAKLAKGIAPQERLLRQTEHLPKGGISLRATLD